jgi:NADPH:quinone reductase-like Zn-dependent oxidoreductase
MELAAPQPELAEVSIDVHYAGVNFKDVMARRGDPGYVPDWPFVPGLEVAGTVRALGSGVSTLEVDDRVTAFTYHGGLAEVAVAPAELTVRVPARLDLERAAAAPGALTTARFCSAISGTFARARSCSSTPPLGRLVRRWSDSPDWRAQSWCSGRSAPQLGSHRPHALDTTTRWCAAPA